MIDRRLPSTTTTASPDTQIYQFFAIFLVCVLRSPPINGFRGKGGERSKGKEGQLLVVKGCLEVIIIIVFIIILLRKRLYLYFCIFIMTAFSSSLLQHMFQLRLFPWFYLFFFFPFSLISLSYHNVTLACRLLSVIRVIRGRKVHLLSLITQLSSSYRLPDSSCLLVTVKSCSTFSFLHSFLYTSQLSFFFLFLSFVTVIMLNIFFFPLVFLRVLAFQILCRAPRF